MMRREWFYFLVLVLASTGFGKPKRSGRYVELMPVNSGYTAERTPTYSSSSSASDTSFDRIRHRNRLGINSGLSALSTSGSNSNPFYLGVLAESHSRFLGFEVDGFYLSGNLKNNTTLQNDSLDQFGIFGNLNFEIPIPIPYFLIVPKIGLGYGLTQTTWKPFTNVVPAPVPNTKESLHGAYITFGGEIDPLDFMILSLDYSFSFYTNGSLSGGGTTTTDMSLNKDNSNFNRLRLGAFFRLGRQFILGAQFIRRVINIQIPATTTTGGSITQEHYLGTIGIEF